MKSKEILTKILLFDGNDFLESNNRKFLKKYPEYKLLEKILLKNGGDYIVLQSEPDFKKLISSGSILDKKSIVKEGQASHCHQNSAGLWNKYPKKYTIYTGWALSEDGYWRQHSWLYEKKRDLIVDTTSKRVKYFGIPLTEEESDKFFWANID